uniref:Uncharacterized protein n=1 Tax=viral metagenome TaxID=1070528 RepID=A0A6M3LF43_9ZZZZ
MKFVTFLAGKGYQTLFVTTPEYKGDVLKIIEDDYGGIFEVFETDGKYMDMPLDLLN